MAAIPQYLIPAVRKQDIRSKHEHDLESWKRFASRIQKNPVIKSFVFSRDKYCQACGKSFGEGKRTPFHVHHIDYDHACGFDKTVAVLSDVRVHHLPDCGRCQIEQPSSFEGCVSRLSAVHPICNMKIEKMAERYYMHPAGTEEVSQDLPKASLKVLASAPPIPWLKKGVVFQWIENIKSSSEKTGRKGRRSVIAGMQKVTGSVEIIEGDYIIVKVLNAHVIER